MGYLRTDEMTTEILRNGEDVSVCVVYTAKMYSDGSGAHSAVIEQVLLDDNTDIASSLTTGELSGLADWVIAKLERP